MSIFQKTLAAEFALEGQGLHTGAKVKATFKPAPVDSGYQIKRIDLENAPVFDAVAENVVNTTRSTVIGKGEATVSTIEHALSALYASGIDNCLIEINGPEMPIMEGSARPFIDKIKAVGIEEQDKKAFVFKPTSKIEYTDENSGSSIVILPDDKFSVSTLLSFEGSNLLSNQYANMDSLDNYEAEVAACKTFVFLHELEPLLKNNQVRGGNLDNALVIVDKEVSQEELDRLADLFNHEHVNVESNGYLSNTELTYTNEPARHKILDVIGDLSLIGCRIEGKVIATKPGHHVNTETAKLIRKAIKRNPEQVPSYDPTVEPFMDVNQIKTLLPHRPPFLMIDKILRIEDSETIIGLKNVSMNEDFFRGHFPEEPVMPGVLLVEAMAQTMGILVLSEVDEPDRYSTYFLKIDNVKFRRKVVPGDTVIFKLELTSPIRRGIASARGLAFVGDKVVAEAEFMAQIIKNK
ncbi:bifunctional UDP-3-O-[3-hydroxymyristoyl] N-acetylglucosamine deacetylase/3-hydroxyacyl-ACP dehydratase [Saccharicrinis sp. FJH54]|uniref:bifunctional UDP-3-O-[3-hydroxymyristoyl] N-acetylglucosamine deacetylase/3-hydroxyacyl-ACP dehydratase n=1 Tax=Saccharicrinis sp. FJH54 TaxID=3344665 RepID=UPI0035D4BDCD